MKRCFTLLLGALLLLGSLHGARADGTDDQYLSIFSLIQEADSLGSSRPADALAKYLQAQSALQKLQRGYPAWNANVVTFRLKYLESHIAALSSGLPSSALAAAAAAQKAAATAPARPANAAPSDWEEQLDSLKGQLRQLSADKVVLESKLKEALSVQPASLDPRELTRAQEKLNGLLKENDLLKLSFEREKAKPGSGVDAASLAQLRQELLAASRKLQEQSALTEEAAKDKKALQMKLDNLPSASYNAATIEKTRKELEEAKNQLATEKQLSAKLATEKDALLLRYKALQSEFDATAALKSENALLKKQLAELKAAAPAKSKAESPSRQLSLARAQIASLESDKTMLRLEKVALENRVLQLLAAASAAGAAPAAPAPPSAPAKPAPAVAPVAAPAPAPAAPDQSARLKQLEGERDELQKRLDSLLKEQAERNHQNQSAAPRVQELESQLAGVRARLLVYETQQVPYTAEELLLFKTPAARLAAAPAPSVGPAATSSPSPSAKLVVEARNFFAAGKLERAEESYQQVLKQENHSVAALANLAAIQLERQHLEAAETNLKQALALAPEDPYSLSLLGSLKFRQGKYDQALEALTHAARLSPDNAEIQNYLGLALSEKGLRGPAETALRKAIQLQPDYASAHNNLAVVYITQKPALTELARYHYQKALAAGHARNGELEKLLGSLPQPSRAPKAP